MSDRGADPLAEWKTRGHAVDDLFDATWSSIWDLQQGWHVAEAAVEDFARSPRPVAMDASRERGWIEVFQDGAEPEIAASLLSSLLPRYCIILSVALMDGFFADYRAIFPKSHRPKGVPFALPVPPWISRPDLDASLYPTVGRFLELRAARHLFVHNRGVIDERYLETVGQAARGQFGEPYPLSRDTSWEALVTCTDLLMVVRSLWDAVLEEDPSYPRDDDGHSDGAE